MRLKEIMHADPAARKAKRRGIYVVLALALTPVAALQFAWAQTAAPNQAPATAPAQPGAPAPQYVTSVMVAPVDGPISLGFGPRLQPLNGMTAFHQGVDFPVPVGTPVHAPADGTVSAARDRWGFGKVVELDHGNGLKTRFAHLSSQQVKVGDKVKAGQVIALSGDTGTLASAGPHLHFEVWKNGKPIDPAKLLGLKTAEADTPAMWADRMQKNGSVVTAEGHAKLDTGTELIHADYIQWDHATGKIKASGNINIDHTYHTKTYGLFPPAAAN